DRIVRAAAGGFLGLPGARAEGGGPADHAVVPAYSLDERADGRIGVAAVAGSPGAAALRAGVRFRLRGSYFAGAAWRVRWGRARERQPSIAAVAQGRHSRPATRAHSLAQH